MNIAGGIGTIKTCMGTLMGFLRSATFGRLDLRQQFASAPTWQEMQICRPPNERGRRYGRGDHSPGPCEVQESFANRCHAFPLNLGTVTLPVSG